MMQELVRRYFDEVLDRKEEGKQVESPFICTVSQGETGTLPRNRHLLG